jgi:uncharacterized RDD family membrane protein YckC
MEDEYPSLIARFQSIFIDTIFIIVLMFIIYLVLDYFPDAPDWLRVFLFISIFFIYEPVCLAFGCTIGNYFKRIRVKKFNDTTRRINILSAIVRSLVKICLGWISFLTVHTNPSKRALHDLASGSVMIKLR